MRAALLLSKLFSQIFVLLTLAAAAGLFVLFFHPKAADPGSHPRLQLPLITEEEVLQDQSKWIVLRVDPGLSLPQTVRVIDFAPEDFEELLGPLLDLFQPDMAVAVGASTGLETSARIVAERLDREADIRPVFLLQPRQVE